jgi:hypothetical protein
VYIPTLENLNDEEIIIELMVEIYNAPELEWKNENDYTHVGRNLNPHLNSLNFRCRYKNNREEDKKMNCEGGKNQRKLEKAAYTSV